MKHMIALSAALLSVAACKDETLSGYAPKNTSWVWQELDGTPAPARATLRLPRQGQVTGRAPCNNYSARQTAPYPWFKVEAVTATKVACPDLKSETMFFDALAQMSLAEVSGDTLLLSNDDGREMLFVAAP